MKMGTFLDTWVRCQKKIFFVLEQSLINKENQDQEKDKTYFFHYLNKHKTAKIHIQELIYKHLILQECIIIKTVIFLF